MFLFSMAHHFIVVQLVEQNSTLKKEAGIAERKLLARNERIHNLEALLHDADRRLSVQNQKFEAQLQAVKERLDQARGEHKGFMRLSKSHSFLCLCACSTKSGDIDTPQLWSYCKAASRRRRSPFAKRDCTDLWWRI